MIPTRPMTAREAAAAFLNAVLAVRTEAVDVRVIEQPESRRNSLVSPVTARLTTVPAAD